jgi:hypothetical protein
MAYKYLKLNENSYIATDMNVIESELEFISL